MKTRAFTLVELLIVVIILGILAAIVVPQFTDASGDAQLSSLQADLGVIRRQIQYYKAQHNGSYPALASFASLMTQKTNSDGTTTGAPALGPYLESVPLNPFMGTSTIGNGAVGTSAWYYDDVTGTFRANCHAAHTGY